MNLNNIISVGEAFDRLQDIALKCGIQDNVSNDLRRWTVFSAYEAAWHVRFTTLL